LSTIAVDIFSGAGGLSLGFKWAGFRIAVALDRDGYARQTYAHNNPEVLFLQRSVRTISGREILRIANVEKVDVLIAGPPCSPYSMANRQRNGSAHPDSDAVHHFLRLVGEIHPRSFVMENVRGIQFLNGGRTFKRICSKAKAQGYEVQQKILEATALGVPQRRKRLFLIGFENGNPDFNFNSLDVRLNVLDAISDLPSLPEGGGGAIEMNYNKESRTDYQKLMRGSCHTLLNHMSTLSSPLSLARFKHIPPKGSLRTIWDKLPQSLKKGISSIKKVHWNIYRRLPLKEPSYTIVHVRKAVLIHPYEHRLISAREAARLQSFPDSYRFFGGIDAQYQQIADATPPLVAKALAERIAVLLK